MSHHFINGKPCPFTTYFQIWFLILERVPKGGLKTFLKTYLLNLPNLRSPLWRALHPNHWTDCEVSLYCTKIGVKKYSVQGVGGWQRVGMGGGGLKNWGSKIFFLLYASGRGGSGRGGIGGAPYKKMGVQRFVIFFFYSVQGVGGAALGEGGVKVGVPYKKMGVQFFLFFFFKLCARGGGAVVGVGGSTNGVKKKKKCKG